jgi:hypothetical protein
MKINVLGLAVFALLLSAGGAMAVDQAAPSQSGGIATSPGVAGSRVPAESPPATGMLPGSPGPYPSQGSSAPSAGAGSSSMPAPSSSGSAAPSGANPG